MYLIKIVYFFIISVPLAICFYISAFILSLLKIIYEPTTKSTRNS